MKPVILHIGSTKTGTSSLQQYLTQHAGDLARQGVVYPMAGRRASGQIAHHNLCYERQAGRVRTGVFRPEVGVWSEALAEIDGPSATVGIISSEAFMNCKPQQVASFREELAGRDVAVVAYVRRQDLWLQSAWNQQARFGRCSLDFWEFYAGVRKRGRGDYHLLLEPWAEAFGPERLFVRNFDALSANGIVPDFFETFVPSIGAVDVPRRDARRNTKAGIKQLLAVSLVIDACRGTIGPEYEMASSTAIRIADFFRHRTDEVTTFSVVTYEDACRLHHEFEGSNRRLAELSPSFLESGGFPEPRPDEYLHYVDLTTFGDDVLSGQERRFVERMVREVVRAGRFNART